MAAPVYESTGTYGQSAGAAPAATVTCGVPSGVVADDIVELHIYSDPTGSVITPPAGFAEAPDSPTIIDGSQDQRLSVYWKRATGSESGTYTTTFSTNTFAEASAIRISGCSTSGSPYDDTASDTDDTLTTTVTPALSLTTTVANTLLVHVGANWNGGTWTPSTGFTTRASGGFNLLHVATKAQAATGSTGTVQATCATTNTLTSAWLGALIAPADAAPVGGKRPQMIRPGAGPSNLGRFRKRRMATDTPSQAATADLTPASVTIQAQPLNPVPGAVTTTLTAAQVTLAAQPLNPVPGAVTVNLTPALLTLTAQPVTPVPGAVTVALTPSVLTLSAIAFDPVGVGPGLVPATLTLTAVALNPVPGPVTVSLSPASLTLAAQVLTPTPGAVTVSLTPAVLTLAGVVLDVRSGLAAAASPRIVTTTRPTPITTTSPGRITTTTTQRGRL